MARNAILLISTMAVLLLLFAGYSSLVGSPTRQGEGPADSSVALPTPTQVADEHKLSLEEIKVDPGEKMAYVNYDRLGRPTDYFRCENWKKVPGTRNDLAVGEPELMMRLPSGMVVTVTADRGQISAERVHSKRVQPKCGWLEGNARIIVDRDTSIDRTPLSERPEDQITIEMERLNFDLDLGELKTAGPLRVSSPEFEITGTGLHLIWNRDDNRVEKLLIEQGGQMLLKGALLGSLDATVGGPQERAESLPATRPAQPVRAEPATGTRQAAAYRCVFSEGVTVDHYVNEQHQGGLQADELVLLFDVGGRSRGLPGRDQTAASAPASQPTEGVPRCLVVRWNGRLALDPAARPSASAPARRQFEARGRPVIVTLPNGAVRCSRLVLHEETKRLWLYAEEGGCVELSSANELSVQATGMFADLDRSIVKLIGDVRFTSDAGAGRDSESLTVRCDLWAELHLAAGRERNVVGDVFDNPLASRSPEVAVFVGAVELEYADQMLRAHRLEAHFRRIEDYAEPDALLETAAVTSRSESEGKVPALQALLESVVASGDVRLRVVDSSGRRGWQRVVARSMKVFERALVRALSEGAPARARARASHGDRVLRCARLQLAFALSGGEVHVREMEASGAVEIMDYDSRFAARGRRVTATFVGQDELAQATVRGTAAAPALVRARAYALGGTDINVDNRAGTLHVDGPSKLAFRSRRSLQGRTRRRAETITVTSSASLHIDDRQNTVDFIGEVVAGTGDEQLLADALTLLLEDVKLARPPAAWSQAKDVIRLIRGRLFSAPEQARRRGPLLATTRSRSGDRKDLARVLAHNAVIQSETRAAGDGLPLVHQSIAAPELEVDVRRRCIRTSGNTTLLMTDRRLRGEAGLTRAALGIPSALMDRGPSQTAMQCSGSLFYVLGEEGPQREDSVLFEGGVRLRHVAGREMVNLEQMLPEVAANPELLVNLKSRNTYMECDRLEGVFAATEEARDSLGLRPSLQLSLLNAYGNVYLRDQQSATIRSIYAHQVDVDLPQRVVRVLGLPSAGIDARVYDENPETGRFNGPIQFPEIIIDLDTNTIRGRGVRGQAGG